MAPKKPPSALDTYGHLSLDALAALSDADDEEVDSAAAFDSDDERAYGRYFASNSDGGGIVRSRNLALPIPLQHRTVRIVEIAAGSKLTLSSVCLDVNTCDFDRIQLMVRCVYPHQTMGQVDDFACLVNYLGAQRGGAGVSPSTPVSLEVMGPCTVEFRAEVAPASFVGGGINVFGLIAPTNGLVDEDEPFRYADAFLSEDEEVGSESEGEGDSESASGSDGARAGPKAKKKRKMEDAADAKQTKQQTDEPASQSTPATGNAKLSKSQRKKLAREKAAQLEETLSAARNDVDAAETKKSQKTKTDTSKRKSLTRERRLAGGLVVSDVLLGTGAPVKPGKRISLHYTGIVKKTGATFDKNHSKQHPLVFRQGTGEVIRGLERGLEGMKAGGERVITVPSKLGYGTKGAGADIPPDADLVFEVKVLKVG
ncbi:hypothetical protein ACHAXT_001460 [Thalassiosira profunda]